MSETPIHDGKYCGESGQGKTCPHLKYDKGCDTVCRKYEKAPHPVWMGAGKPFRLSRCPQCVAEFGGAS